MTQEGDRAGERESPHRRQQSQLRLNANQAQRGAAFSTPPPLLLLTPSQHGRPFPSPGKRKLSVLSRRTVSSQLSTPKRQNKQQTER